MSHPRDGMVGMSTHPLARLQSLAATQYGLVSLAQAERSGVSPSQIKRLVAAGLLDRPYRGVLRLVAVSETWEQAVSAALLAGGDESVASHRAAARLHRLEGSESWPVEIVVPRGGRPRGLDVRVRESTDLEEGDITRRQGLRVTTPTRTLVDLGASVGPTAVEVALDDALRRRLTTPAMLRETIERVEGRGRAGPRVIRDLLDERDELAGLTDTGFETRLRRLLRRAGLPQPVAQVVVRDELGRFVMRLDFAYPEVRVGIEADSERWHTGMQRFHADRTKRATAESLGWTILAFTHRHVVREPTFVADTVARTLATRTQAEHASVSGASRPELTHVA